MTTCYRCASGTRVTPIQLLGGPHQITEVRENRSLSIYHYNARPRDINGKFSKPTKGKQLYNPASVSSNGQIRPTSSIPRLPLLSKRTAVSSDTKSSNTHRDMTTESDVTHPMSPSGVTPRLQNGMKASSSKNDRVNVENTVIFLLHGVGGCASVWTSQTNFFSDKGFELVIPELIGHGFSPGPKSHGDYHFNQIAEDVLAIFDKHCKERNIVIGHSYGSCFAAVLATERSELVTHLILISGGAPIPLAPEPGCFNCCICCLWCCRPAITCIFNRSAFTKQMETEIKAHAFSIPSYVLKYVMQGQIWPQGDEKYFSEIDTPTLIIHGRQDKLVTDVEAYCTLQVMPDAELYLVDNASHMVMMESPEEVNGKILQFITRNFKVY